MKFAPIIRYNFLGDKTAAKGLRGVGQSLVPVLQNLSSFRGLKQNTFTKRFSDNVVMTASHCFNQFTVDIWVRPPVVEPIKVEPTIEAPGGAKYVLAFAQDTSFSGRENLTLFAYDIPSESWGEFCYIGTQYEVDDMSYMNFYMNLIMVSPTTAWYLDYNLKLFKCEEGGVVTKITDAPDIDLTGYSSGGLKRWTLAWDDTHKKAWAIHLSQATATIRLILLSITATSGWVEEDSRIFSYSVDPVELNLGLLYIKLACMVSPTEYGVFASDGSTLSQSIKVNTTTGTIGDSGSLGLPDLSTTTSLTSAIKAKDSLLIKAGFLWKITGSEVWNNGSIFSAIYGDDLSYDATTDTVYCATSNGQYKLDANLDKTSIGNPEGWLSVFNEYRAGDIYCPL